MLKRMTFDDLMWWRAYEVVEPFGEQRDDFRAASICAATMNAALLRTGVKQRFSPSDFLLEFKEGPPPRQQEGTEAKPAAPTAHWLQMKSIAKMHFAIAKATKDTRQKARARTHERREHRNPRRKDRVRG